MIPLHTLASSPSVAGPRQPNSSVRGYDTLALEPQPRQALRELLLNECDQPLALGSAPILGGAEHPGGRTLSSTGTQVPVEGLYLPLFGTV